MTTRWRCKTCNHVSKDIWRDMHDQPRCRRCRYGHVVPVPNSCQVAMALLCERVSVRED